MNDKDRTEFGCMQKDLRLIKDSLIVALENHLTHIENDVRENREMVEQIYGVADSAEKRAESAERTAKRTERFAIAGIGFFGIVIAIIQCVGG